MTSDGTSERSFINYRFDMYRWVVVGGLVGSGGERKQGVVVARSECEEGQRTYCVRFPDGHLLIVAEQHLDPVLKLPAEQADQLNDTVAWGAEGQVPETPADARRWADRFVALDRLNKGALVAMYRELGGLSPAMTWRKDEVINAVIDMERRAHRVSLEEAARLRAARAPGRDVIA